jgi:uncharacterized protein (TIGR02594 family)
VTTAPIDIGWRYLGLREIPGPFHEPVIQHFLEGVGLGEEHGDETAWCSGFVNHCIEGAGLPGTGKPNARSWLEWGHQLEQPTYGCVCVLWREDRLSWKGHVGFFLGMSHSRVALLGGNQGNAVDVTDYPRERILEFREMAPAIALGGSA